MRVLILNTDYEAFLEDLYTHVQGLADRTYDEQMEARNRSLFGVADFYSQGLKANGLAAADLHLNNRAMQLRWAAENGAPIGKKAQGAESRGIVAAARRLFGARQT